MGRQESAAEARSGRRNETVVSLHRDKGFVLQAVGSAWLPVTWAGEAWINRHYQPHGYESSGLPDMACPKPHVQRHRGTAGPPSSLILNDSSGLLHWERLDPGTCLSQEYLQAQKEAGMGSCSCGGTRLIHIYYQPEN